VPFQPNGFYRVEIKTDENRADGSSVKGVHDLAGNPLDNAFMWTFRTTDAPFEPTWSISLSVTDGVSSNANNIAAVEYGALDEEDEKDVRAVPALSSQLCLSFLKRSSIEGPPPTEFDRDIRPADGRLSHHWFFVICDAANGSDVTINYKPSVKLTKSTRQYQTLRLVEFDNAGQVTNTITLDPTEAVDEETGAINEVPAYTYTNDGEASRYFRLDVQKVGFVAGTFERGTSGWKFFSVPIKPQRDDPFVNLGDDIDPFQLYRYDTQLSGYKVYPYDIGEVSLQKGHGYFTRLEKSVEVDVGGTANSDLVTLELNAKGWHAIGNPFTKEVNVADLQITVEQTVSLFDDAVAAGWVEGALYRWNTTAKSDAYEEVTTTTQDPNATATTLKSWDGYWLKTNQADLTLTIPTPDGLDSFVPLLPGSYNPPIMASPVAVAEHAASLLKGQFKLKLALTSDFASDLTTTFGTRPNAKVGWDVQDSTEPPILSNTVAVYFEHTDWGENNGQYNRDYQPILEIGSSRTWKFAVYTKNPGAEMNLSWEKAIAQVPDDIMLYFRRLDEELAGQSHAATTTHHSSLITHHYHDMREVQSVKLTSRFQSTKIPFEVRAERFAMAPPSDVQVIAGEKQVLLHWGGNSHDNEFISGYTITRNTQHATSNTQYAIPNTQHEFVDTNVEEEATYTYQVTVHFISGAELHSEPFTVTVLPAIKETTLLQSYPNPFNPDTWIPYELEKETEVKIEVYNAAGQLIRTLDLGVQPRGRYISKSKSAYWDGRSEFGERSASGLYFYVLKAGNFTATRKMAILK